MELTAYLGATTAHELVDGQIYHHVTLVLPKLTTEELSQVLSRVNDLGELEVSFDNVPVRS